MSVEDDPSLVEAQRRIGVQFRDPALLGQAFVHRSVLRESSNEHLQSNERLEFLGDAIIGAFVARYLFDRMPTATEGELTLVRTWLVRASTLAQWAIELELEQFLRLGRGDEGGKRRTRLLARTFEAVVGAIYADRGVRGVERFLRPLVKRELERRGSGRPELDAKSRLQQVTQSRYELVPEYVTTTVSGPGHDPTFTVEVRVGTTLATSAIGSTKQEAEQAAARDALEILESRVALNDPVTAVGDASPDP